MRINLGLFSFNIGGKKNKGNQESAGVGHGKMSEQEIREKVNSIKLTTAEALDMSESIGAFDKVQIDEAKKTKLSEKLAKRINETKTTDVYELSNIVTEVFNEFGVPIKEKVALHWADSFFESYIFDDI